MPDQPADVINKRLSYFDLRSSICLDRLRNDLMEIRQELEKRHQAKPEAEMAEDPDLYRPRSLACLRPGIVFTGNQKSRSNEYQVSVILNEVDLRSSHVSGYLRIEHLTADFPELTTFFSGEVIGLKHRFLTAKWVSRTISNF